MTLTGEAAPRTRLQFGVLGPLSASLDGVDIGLGGRRQRAVVAVLLIARGQQVSTERLLDALWDGEPPPSGAASLQSYVSHLRRALEPDRPARTPSQVLVSGPAGYAMPVGEDDVDAWRFERLVDQAATSADPADPAAGRCATRSRCGGARRWRSTPARTGPTSRRAGSRRSARSPASSCWRPGSTAARRRWSSPRSRRCWRRHRCARSAGGCWRSRCTARTGRPTRSTRCAGRGRCSPTSSASTPAPRCARWRPRCWPSRRRWTRPRRCPRRPRLRP